MEKDRFGNVIDTFVGFARGKILTSTQDELKEIAHGKKIMIDRYNRLGRKGLVQFIDLTDNFGLPPEFTEVYDFGALSVDMRSGELLKLAREHLGGNEEYNKAAVFNRTTLGAITTMLALGKPGTVIVSLVPESAREHISMRRAKQLAGCESLDTSSPNELEEFIENKKVSLIAITGASSKIMEEDALRKGIEIGKVHGIPTFVDDAYGARMRTLLFNQAKAGDLGADIILTGANKFGFKGPKAGIMLGREEYMKKVLAKAWEIGALARPAIVGAAIKTLRDFDAEKMKSDVKKWAKISDEFVKLANVNGIPAKSNVPTRTTIPMEDVLQITMEKAGISHTDIVPCEATRAFGLYLLDKYGWIIDPVTGSPGTNMNLSAFFHYEDIFWIEGGAEEVVNGHLEAFDWLAGKIGSADVMKKVLFGE
jgi:L-seryl-tRNA(Ser) seleniumtransferase